MYIYVFTLELSSATSESRVVMLDIFQPIRVGVDIYLRANCPARNNIFKQRTLLLTMVRALPSGGQTA
jgi:hypothetical protein